jgi:hypothetical protein
MLKPNVTLMARILKRRKFDVCTHSVVTYEVRFVASASVSVVVLTAGVKVAADPVRVV